MEWPPHSGKKREFAEVDRAEFFTTEEAKKRINPAQVALLERLEQIISRRSTGGSVADHEPPEPRFARQGARQSLMDRAQTRRTFSLWLMPTGRVYRRLAKTILSLSRRYATPPFEPHITVLGGIADTEPRAKARSARLARRLEAFGIRLTTVGYRDEYFRCLFIRVSRTRALVETRVWAARIFHHPRRRAFFPHLSLMYADIARRDKKELASFLGPRFKLKFEVKRLHLFATSGDPRGWRRLKTFRLKPRK